MTEREIFFEALEMTTPEARAGYLQGACGHDITLRRKVDELLKEHFSNPLRTSANYAVKTHIKNLKTIFQNPWRDWAAENALDR